MLFFLRVSRPRLSRHFAKMRPNTRHRLALYFKGTTQAARRELLTNKLLSSELPFNGCFLTTASALSGTTLRLKPLIYFRPAGC